MDANLSDINAILGRTPATLRALLTGMPDAFVRANEGDGTFSPHDVVGHLIYAEEADWMPRVTCILEHGKREPFPPFDRFGFRGTISAMTMAELLDEFERQRTGNLAALHRLQLRPEQFADTGTHPAFGPVTLGQLLATWAVHDLNHIAQIVRVMSKQYSAAVGPWKEYLRILNA